MAWFKVDDGLYGHPKWLAASKGARALWVSAGSWAASQLTDGEVPGHVLAVVGGSRKEASELVSLGLWIEDGASWWFHDWEEHQPLREDVEAISEQRGRTGKRGAHLRWHKARGIKKPGCTYCEEESQSDD